MTTSNLGHLQAAFPQTDMFSSIGTLLTRLFGTIFDIMDGLRRHLTMQGIAVRDFAKPNLLRILLF
jgi:hypothetical protein